SARGGSATSCCASIAAARPPATRETLDDARALGVGDPDRYRQRDAARVEVVGDLDAVGLPAGEHRLAVQRIPQRAEADPVRIGRPDDLARGAEAARVEQHRE